MKKLHRSLSWLLLLAMLFSMLSVGGFAADDTISTTTGVVETTSVPAAEEEAKEEAPAVSETPSEKAPVVSETPTEDNAADTQNATQGLKPVEKEDVSEEGDKDVAVQDIDPYSRYATSGTFDHIEIELAASVKYTVDGKTYTQPKDDMIEVGDEFTVTATQNGKTLTADVAFDYTSVSITGNGDNNGATVKIKGKYPTGTKENPVIYTVTTTKNIQLTNYNNQTVPVTLSVTTNYWDEENACPGLGDADSERIKAWKAGKFVDNMSGIDVPISGEVAGLAITSGKVMIKKVVEGGNNNDTFNFTVMNVTTGKYASFTNNEYTGWSDTAVNVSVQAGKTVTLSKVPVGTYRITEIQHDGYIVVDADGNYSTKDYSVDYTVEKKDDSDIPVATFTNKKLSNETGISLKKVATGLSANANYPNPTVTIKNSNGASVWSGTLTANGDTIYLSKTLSAGTYTVEETDHDVTGYNCDTKLTVNGTAQSGMSFTVTNADYGKILALQVQNTYTEKPTTMDFTVTKKWVHPDGYEGDKPESVTVQLYKDGEAVPSKTAKLNASNNWTYTFKELAISDKYTAKEVVVPENYVESGKAVDCGYEITNTHIPETTSVSGTKTWVDDNDRDCVRPASITVTLTGTVEGEQVSEASMEVEPDNKGEWNYSFTNLPKYNGGKKITYTVSEKAVNGYTTTYSKEGYDITNTHAIETTSVTVKKIWNDKDNQDNIRPDHIEFYLYANDEITDATYCISASDDWMITIPDLPKNEDGKAITYTVKEVGVTEGYTPTYNYDEFITITNTYDVAKTSVSVEKKWDDANNQDGLRVPVTIELLADGKPVETAILNEDNNWKHTFTDLEVNAAGSVGKAVEYTVKEVTKVDGYEAGEPVKTGDAENGYAFTITNTHTPATYEKITVTKVWDDNENQDGKRTPSVQVTLLANTAPVENGTVTLDESNNWTYAFENLPVKSNGKEIEYTIVEITDLTQLGYSAAYSGDAEDGFVVTNSRTPETTDITVFKAWDDNDNQDGLRPASIKVQLYANGQQCGEAVTITPTAEDLWFYNFEDLPVYAGGKEIKYTVEEVEVTKGYTATAGDADNNYTITNSHTPETTSISGKKIWNDDNNRDGLRSDDVYIEVIGTIDDGEIVYGYGYLVTEDDDWAYTFENLPVYFDGKKITYTLQEDMSYIDGFDDIYVSTVVEDKETGEINVINTHIPETTSITVNKVWADNNDQDGIRPEEITVYLTVDGEKEPSYIAKMTPDKDGKWSYTFFGLPKYKDREEITYVVSEEKVEGYESEVSVDQKTGEVTITNTHDAATTKVSIEKIWKDNNDKKEKRPDSIKVTLYANGKEVTAVELNEKNQWKTEIENLPVNANGKAIEYTVKEAGVKYYVGKVTGSVKDGFTVTNTFVDIPLTGDTMNLLFWSIMILGAGAVLTGVTVHNRRKRA